MIRVERDEVPFAPVTIIIDNRNDLDTFLMLLQTAYQNSSRFSDVEVMAESIIQTIGGAIPGWQSSSENC